MLKPLDQLEALLEKAFGYRLHPLSPPEVLRLLQSGTADIVMVLHWDERNPQHQLVLEKLTEDRRIVFYNSLKTAGAKKGMVLHNPHRVVEGECLESVSFETFRSFFTEHGAMCFGTRSEPG